MSETLPVPTGFTSSHKDIKHALIERVRDLLDTDDGKPSAYMIMETYGGNHMESIEIKYPSYKLKIELTDRE